MKIRKTTESETRAILSIHSQAFGTVKGPEIAKLVSDLLGDETAFPLLSLVAVHKNKLIGHILFTKVEITGTEHPVAAQILAPLAILPEEQTRGVGQKLIHEGLRLLKESGTEVVFVLGHPTYYPRCGFIPAGEQGFEAPYPIPEEYAEAWMVQELVGSAIDKNSGKVRCSKVLDEPQHWRE
ncbi:MAG: N-acetyltransferase [Desulfobulbaceae bacterium]|nr:MAG: N-acetyltransferase [Desulfobulbaceae bacterium]